MPVYTDQMGRNISISEKPKRIISLVPSQTELLYHLGLEAAVIGITKFCVRPPEWFEKKTKIGGTKLLHLDEIIQLQPDLILANKEENTKEEILTLEKLFPVWMSDIKNLKQALEMITAIGKITGTLDAATAINRNIREKFSLLAPCQNKIRTAYLIWKDPYITVGGDTFIGDMLRHCGLQNIFDNSTRYPPISLTDLKKERCELLLLSSEPFPFAYRHQQEIQRTLPDTKILLVDGEMFSWYGSRLLHAPPYFSEIIQYL